MEKKAKDSEINTSFKSVAKEVIIGVIVGVLVSLISKNFFTIEKDSGIILLLFFVIGLVVYLFIFLIRKLLKEVETKKDLQSELRKVKDSLKLTENFCSYEKKSKESLEKENNKLRNERNQLKLVLSSYGTLREIQEKVGIDGNISFLEWHKKPGIEEKLEEITQREFNKWLESEGDVSDLSRQLEYECEVSKDNQHVSDKRQKKWVIEYVENYWKYNIKADRNTGEIKGKTIEQFLGKHWRDTVQSRKGRKDIIEEKYRLKKLIDDFAKNIH